MFLRYRTLGFVFKKEDKGEADQIFKIFTKDFGKVEVLAKGIRKISSKLRPQIDIFYLSEIEFIQGKIYKRLIGAFCVEKFKNLRRSFKRLSIAYQTCEALDKLIKGEEKDERIWKLILEVFISLDKEKFKVCSLVYFYFFWKLASILGHKPELYFCCGCQKRPELKKVYFNPGEGGIICQTCFSRIKQGEEVSQNLIKILRIILEKNLEFLKKVKAREKVVEELKEISNSYFLFLTQNNV